MFDFQITTSVTQGGGPRTSMPHLSLNPRSSFKDHDNAILDHSRPALCYTSP